MGLMLTTTEHMFELENQVESLSIGLANMEAENRKMQKAYRNLRDSKDAEIERLNAEIRRHKIQKDRDNQTIEMLRAFVTRYEEQKKNANSDINNTVSLH